MNATYHRIISEAELSERGVHGTIVNGWPVAVARGTDGYHAFVDKCTHASSRLSTGRTVRAMIQCPLHGARFTMATGACVGANHPPLLTFAHRLVDGWIEVAVPDAPPGVEHQPAQR